MKNAIKIPISHLKRNAFDLSHEVKLSCLGSRLIPIFKQDVVPTDKLRVSSEIFVRLAPMLAPVMHRMNVRVHYFFVPYRILWDEWEKFITGGEDGLQAPTFPTIGYQDANKTYFAQGGLADYMGVPPLSGTVTNIQNISALPFRAYQRIWNDYFRDQNLTPAMVQDTGSTTTSILELLSLRTPAWEKDYFTSALPWAQRGNAVNIPVANTVVYKPTSTVHKNPAGSFTANGFIGLGSTVDGGSLKAGQTVAGTGGNDSRIENISAINTTGTIQDLRTAARIQEWLEKAARGGGRYTEHLLNFFGIKNHDSRLQRPEYLGGGKQPITISEVTASYGNKTDTYLGEYAGHGISIGKSNRFSKGFSEHGIVLGLMSITPRTAYGQGLEKLWNKTTSKYDYYFPQFAHLGEQAIQNKEVFFTPTGTDVNNATWGYQRRYAEYTYKESSYHGDFRTSLSYWHLGRIFSSLPALNTSFIEATPPDRIFAVEDEAVHKFFIQVYNDVQALRPVPNFSKPTL